MQPRFFANFFCFLTVQKKKILLRCSEAENACVLLNEPPWRLKSKENLNEDELVQRCLKNDRKAQRQLYERYGPVMKMVCLRYLFEKQLAEEVLNRDFFKVFTKMKDYTGEGSLEGWIRRVMVNESLNENRKRKVLYEPDEVGESRFLQQVPEVQSSHEVKYIMAVIEALPEGYRVVFNRAEIEGYHHSEIAKKLQISESSSRSQLARAKKLLRKKLKDLEGF